MEKILNYISQLLTEKKNVIIAIDGYCASGKTTVAASLAEKFDMQVIHMDDFFLPPDMRTEERLSQAGGNVHYERFNSEVVSGLINGLKFGYRVFNCKQGAFTDFKEILPDKPVIIEGSYALHPRIAVDYDFKIFVKADYKTRLCRILERNGEEALEVFKTKWIPLENKYFYEFDIESDCDIIIQTEKL